MNFRQGQPEALDNSHESARLSDYSQLLLVRPNAARKDHEKGADGGRFDALRGGCS